MTRQKNVNSEFRSFGVTVTDGLQGGHTLLPLQVAANTGQARTPPHLGLPRLPFA